MGVKICPEKWTNQSESTAVRRLEAFFWFVQWLVCISVESFVKTQAHDSLSRLPLSHVCFVMLDLPLMYHSGLSIER